MMYGYDGYGLFGGLFMLIFWLLIIGGTVLVVRYATSRTSTKSTSALELLDERLARGEISVNEYHEWKAALTKR